MAQITPKRTEKIVKRRKSKSTPKLSDILPTILKGGKEVPLNPEQRKNLKRVIKIHGRDSVEVKALMLQYASETRVDFDEVPSVQKRLQVIPKRQKPIFVPKVKPAPIKRREKPKANVNDAVKTIIDLVMLIRKRESVTDSKHKAVQKKNYAKAASLKIREQGYDAQIDKTITDLRRLKRFL